MKLFKLIILVGATLSLGACETLEGTWNDIKGFSLSPQSNEERMSADIPMICPQVQIVDELSSLSDFSDMSDMNESNLISRVNLTQVESSCSFDGHNVIVDLKLAFEGQLGVKGKARESDRPTFSYPFFIAVTDNSGAIKAKEIFGASMTYQANETYHTYYESLRQIIPVEDDTEARDFTVMVGFQLSPQQLQYNRKNMVPVEEEASLPLEQQMEAQIKQTAAMDDASPALNAATTNGAQGMQANVTQAAATQEPQGAIQTASATPPPPLPNVPKPPSKTLAMANKAPDAPDVPARKPLEVVTSPAAQQPATQENAARAGNANTAVTPAAAPATAAPAAPEAPKTTPAPAPAPVPAPELNEPAPPVIEEDFEEQLDRQPVEPEDFETPGVNPEPGAPEVEEEATNRTSPRIELISIEPAAGDASGNTAQQKAPPTSGGSVVFGKSGAPSQSGLSAPKEEQPRSIIDLTAPVQ